MEAANTRPWERDYAIKPEDCQFLIVQGPGKYDFIRLAKLDS